LSRIRAFEAIAAQTAVRKATLADSVSKLSGMCAVGSYLRGSGG